MTLLAVSIAVDEADGVETALRRAAGAVDAGARLIEWRVDLLAESGQGAAAAQALVRDAPAPSILTCRLRSEGGRFAGAEARRADLLEAAVLAERPPRYVDCELAAFEGGLRRRLLAALERARAGRDVHPALILSVHGPEGRPPDLLRSVERMTDEPACAVIKVAWHARSLRDNLEALDLLAERRKPTIALCMGPFGLPSRVLAPAAGGLLVFAADAPGAGTAPDQPAVSDLRDLYRFQRIGPETAVYGVIGWPVAHSLGPAVHNAAFEATRRDAVYLPLPVPPEYEHFKATIGAWLDSDRVRFRGASVTAPHKANLVRFVTERGGWIDPHARRMGAANTLVADGSLRCLNTDAPAALQTLCEAMGIDRAALAGRRVAVFGAGGVARAVVAAASAAGARVVVFNRTAQHAEALARAFHGRPTEAGAAAHVVAGRPDAIGCGCFDAVVNCTPVGLAGGPAPEASPLPPDAALKPGGVVMDTVYAPRRTPLLAQAEAAGAKAVGGLPMFLRQAALQFQHWTGVTAPTEAMAEAVEAESRE